MSCPICQRDTAPSWRPFCSKRCADLDLGRWLSGSYALPGPIADENDAEAAAFAAQDEGGGETR